MGIFHKNIQFILDFIKALFLVLHFSYYTLMTLLIMLPVIFVIIALYADDFTLYSKCDQPADLWQQVELPSELESD